MKKTTLGLLALLTLSAYAAPLNITTGDSAINATVPGVSAQFLGTNVVFDPLVYSMQQFGTLSITFGNAPFAAAVLDLIVPITGDVTANIDFFVHVSDFSGPHINYFDRYTTSLGAPFPFDIRILEPNTADPRLGTTSMIGIIASNAPEPGAFGAVGLGLALLGLRRLRRAQ